MARERFDVLVVGGGVVGAGAALDAATRGLSVALVESRDWAAGTSSRSSKLIHGGLRYLEMLDFKLVREALKERGLLLERLAPHLVRPVPFLYPLTRRGWERPYVGAGLVLYDTLALSPGHPKGLPAHRHLTQKQALQLFPSLRPDAFVGAVRYHDAQVDDARYTLTLVRTAAAYGAQVASRAEVVDYLREGERVVGARVCDREQEGYGHEISIHARHVINATGVWTEEAQRLLGDREQVHTRPSKGIHLVVPRERIRGEFGLILRTEESVLFVIPWGRHWIIGTTDTDWPLGKAHPAASASDIDYLLDRVNTVVAQPLTRDDIEGVYAGLRPLLADGPEPSSKSSREHVVARVAPGLVLVAGGKYTTYRVMARDAVDAATETLGEMPPSCTDTVPLLGAEGYRAVCNARQPLARRSGLHLERIDHLLGRYGALVHEVLALIAEQPELGKPLPGADDYLAAEIAYAAIHEGARHLDDVLTRRTRISIETRDRGIAAAEPAGRLMGATLGWDDDDIAREVELYRQRVEAERRSQQQETDRAADAARRRAPDFATAG